MVDVIKETTTVETSESERSSLEVGRYRLNAARNGETLKTAEDGQTILIPQPSDSPDDPLNWTSKRKHAILVTLAFAAFIADFGSAMGAVTTIPQAIQWGLPIATVEHNLVGNLAAMGLGGIFSVVLSECWGRLPALFWLQTLALGAAIWCAAAKDFDSFVAARAISGFFATNAQTTNLLWIEDLFFFHEHPRKINLVSGAIIVGPFVGPLVAAFVTSHLQWQWAFWVYAILTGCSLVLIITLGEEAYFKRDPVVEDPARQGSRFSRLIGVKSHPACTISQALSKPVVILSQISVVLVLVYYFLNFAWIISVNVTMATWLTKFYGFKSESLGLFYLAPITGSILGEIASHWLLRSVESRYLRRHHGRLEPEVRLVGCYLGSMANVTALIVIGFALECHWHYLVLAVFFAVQVGGILIATTAINAYLMDSYPEGSGQVSAWINAARAFGGVAATYAEIPWVTSMGPAKVLGIQSAVAFAAMAVPVILQVYGKSIRRLQAPAAKAT